MASNWLKIRQNIHNEPEIVTMAFRLGVTRYDVAGRVMSVWSWARDHTDKQGCVENVPIEFIDMLAEMDGFAEAMIAAGWLEYDENKGLMFPDHDRWNTKPERNRTSSSAERQRRYRERKRAQQAANEACNGSSDTQNVTSSVTSQSVTVTRNGDVTSDVTRYASPSLSPSCINSFSSPTKEEEKSIDNTKTLGPKDPPGFDGRDVTLLKQMSKVRVDNGGDQIAMTFDLRKMAGDVVREMSHDDVIDTWRWVLTSDHERARFLRKGGYHTPQSFLSRDPVKGLRAAEYLEIRRSKQEPVGKSKARKGARFDPADTVSTI